VEKYGRTGHLTFHYITRRMLIACRIPKDIDTHLAYVKVIAFPQQQWLRERPSNIYIYILNTKCVFLFSLQLLSEKFLILSIIERNMIINMYRSPCKLPVVLLFLSDFN